MQSRLVREAYVDEFPNKIMPVAKGYIHSMHGPIICIYTNKYYTTVGRLQNFCDYRYNYR